MVSYAEESEARRKLNKLDYRLVRNPERDPPAPNYAQYEIHDRMADKLIEGERFKLTFDEVLKFIEEEPRPPEK